MLRIAVILGALALAGCATAPQQSPRVQYVTSEVPQSLRRCQDAPVWSSYEQRARRAQRYATQADTAEFVSVLSAAHRDCKTKLAAVDRLLRRVEARTH